MEETSVKRQKIKEKRKKYGYLELPEADASGSFLFLKGFLILLWKNIQNDILYIQFITDRDISELYQVNTKRLNEQVVFVNRKLYHISLENWSTN